MTVLVVVLASDRERVAEALRGAVGLCLRGDEVKVAIRSCPAGDARIDRAIATLRELGFSVTAPASDDHLAGAIRAADKTEVWT